RYDFSTQPRFTGFVEITEVQPTLALALRLHPGCRRIVLITDTNATLVAARTELSDLRKAFPNVEFVAVNPHDFRMSDLLSRLKNLPSDSVGLLEAFFRNRFGQAFSAQEVTRLISENCPFPVYGVNANTFTYGIVGGKLDDGYFQGV